MVNKLRVSLFFGTIAALCHLVWVVLVAGGWAQGLIDWGMGLHFLNTTHTVQAFDAVKGVYLIAFAFVVGMVDGFILAAIWNVIVGKKK